MDDLFKLIDATKKLPKQRSEQWYKNRKFTIGASIWGKLGGSVEKVLEICKDKLGFSEFRGNAATRFGCLMEPVIQAYVEFMLNTSICEFGSLPGVIDIQSCSPDGVGLVSFSDDIDYDTPITDFAKYLDHKAPLRPVLFEFKCPAMRMINGSMSTLYHAQCKVGMETIPITHHAVFVEGMFRPCSLENLNGGTAYTHVMAGPARYFDNPIACGMIVVKSKGICKTEIIHEKFQDLVRDLYGDNFEPEIIDFGADMRRVNVLLELAELDCVVCEYVNLYRDNIDIDEMVYQMSNNSSIIGVMPWKLFDIDFIPIKRHTGYVKDSEPLARMVMNIVSEYIDIEDMTARREAFDANLLDIKARLKPYLHGIAFTWPNPPGNMHTDNSGKRTRTNKREAPKRESPKRESSKRKSPELDETASNNDAIDSEVFKVFGGVFNAPLNAPKVALKVAPKVKNKVSSDQSDADTLKLFTCTSSLWG